MKLIKIIILFIFIVSHNVVTSKSLVTTLDSIQTDSTYVKYFVKDFNNLTLGHTNSLDTTTLLTSFYDKIDNPHKIYQTLSNSGLAHKDINFIYPYKLGFNTELTAFNKYLHNIDNIKFPIVLQPFTEIKYMMGDKKEQHLGVLFCREFLPRFFITLNYDVDFSPGVYKRTKIHNSFFNV